MKTDKFVPSHPLKTGVLFLVFNRLDTTKKVLKAIAEAKPPRLYIAADGARESKDDEAKKIKEVRDFVMSNIDWECEVKTLFRDQNLGCKMAVSGAIDWFFENEEMGIILEDDCLPSQSFFWFCEELLLKYRDDDDIFIISGDGRSTSSIEINTDYSFVKYPLIWGWASWARAWNKYDIEMKQWPKLKDTILKNVSKNNATVRFWSNVFKKVYTNKLDTWDIQFVLTLLEFRGKCIVPKINLIKNIGFGLDATHTIDTQSNMRI